MQMKEFLYGKHGIEKYSKEFVVITGNYHNTGIINNDLELNILNARTAGIKNVDIYISPCFKPSEDSKICGNGSAAITTVLDYLDENNAKVDRVWLYIFGLSGCNQIEDSWDKDNKTKNVEFIEDMVKILKERNQPFGFFTNKYNWHEITGNIRKYNNTPLMYYNLNGKDNFDDYNEYGYPFGGWEKPTMKEYNFTEICESEVANILQA
uniref:Lysozyme n=1 Tax=Meloidogyne hapla TaxID=6305 RepID=A0A1I8B494_MELHA